MEKPELTKQILDNICRNFNLSFNQVCMYDVNHKTATTSIEKFHVSLEDVLKKLSPLILSMNQEQFFIEEDQIDPRINTTRMANHFKKAEIQSISFVNGLELEQLFLFMEVFSDLIKYPTADSMKIALEAKGIEKVKINYVVFKKMTTDEEVVLRSRLENLPGSENGDAGAPPATPDQKSHVEGTTPEDVLSLMAANIVSEEIEKNITIHKLMESPDKFSEMLIDSDIATAHKSENKDVKPGSELTNNLHKFRQEVDKAITGDTDISMSELAKGVFDLKQKLLNGIEARKAKGVVYIDENKFRHEADEITDNVLIKLITEEYKQGSVSIKRLAQIILRIVPETSELQRILPKLKQALITEGMSLSDFLQLVQELKTELQSDELTRVLDSSAKNIGLDGEDLIQEIMDNPQDAAELIYLAAEIRKGSGDENILSNLLVDYIEKAGSEITLNAMEEAGDKEGKKLHGIFSNARSDLLDKLRGTDVNSEMMNNIEKRLMERMEENIQQLKSNMVVKHVDSSDNGGPSKDTILKILHEHTENKEELKEILDHVKQSLVEKGIEANRFQQVCDEILGVSPEQKKKPKVKGPSRQSLNRGSALFVLEKEISRSNRYDTPFSVLSYSIIKATPKKPVPSGKIKGEDVFKVAVEEMVNIVRETDLVGMLTNKMVMVLQPMTDETGAKLALRRINVALKNREFIIKDIPFEIHFAGSATSFDHGRTPDLKTFIKATQEDHQNILTRLSNIHMLM